MQLDDLTESAQQRAQKRVGIARFEVLDASTRTLSICADDNRVESIEENNDEGLAVGIEKDRKLGESNSLCSSMRSINNCMDKAYKIASLAPNDPNFDGFSSGDETLKAPRVFDKNLYVITYEEVFEVVEAIIKGVSDFEISEILVCTIRVPIAGT